MAIFTFLPKSDPTLPTLHLYPVGLGGRRTQNFFFKYGYTPQASMQKFFLEFSPPISDICLYRYPSLYTVLVYTFHTLHDVYIFAEKITLHDPLSKHGLNSHNFFQVKAISAAVCENLILIIVIKLMNSCPLKIK